jgi:hypothetical protein
MCRQRKFILETGQLSVTNMCRSFQIEEPRCARRREPATRSKCRHKSNVTSPYQVTALDREQIIQSSYRSDCGFWRGITGVFDGRSA